MAKAKKMKVGDWLYHPIHGVVRIQRITNEKRDAETVVRYTLIPQVETSMKVQYVISAEEVESSGFHAVISKKEAQKILDYLKEGELAETPRALDFSQKIPLVEQNEPWTLVKILLCCVCAQPDARERRTRQELERAAKGLVQELAFVFKTTTEETILMVREAIETKQEINPVVEHALVQIAG
jgi:RNA polymerase-interacting CarD/CdnL/TRCF family regulator